MRASAGLVDAGFSSLATFAVGIAAAQLFDASTLGVYAVFFTSYQLGVVIPMFLIYLPAEVKAVARETMERLPILRSSLPIGLTSSLVAFPAVGLALIVVFADAGAATVRNLALTAVIPTMLMPAQAHLRRMLHVASQSWRAASISAVQFTTAIVGLVLLPRLSVPDTAIPFGAFGLASVVSLLAGLLIATTAPQRGAAVVDWRQLTTTGRWLLITGAAPNLAAFAIAALIGKLAGTEALGYAEGARLAAQPMMVLGVGLNASLGPKSMEAGFARDRAGARNVSRVFLRIVGVVMAAYLALAAVPWTWNPLAVLVPQAYVLPGLVALTILVSALAGSVLPYQRELYGGGYEKRLAGVDVIANVVGVVLALSASITGAFARPISFGTVNLWRAANYRRVLAVMYADDSRNNGRTPGGLAPTQENNLS